MHYGRTLFKVVDSLLIVTCIEVHGSSIEVVVLLVEYVLLVVVGVVFVLFLAGLLLISVWVQSDIN
jgi:hypothetical protein